MAEDKDKNVNQDGNDNNDDNDSGQDQDTSNTDKDYIDNLKAESIKNRKKYQEVRDELKKLQDEKLSETEKDKERIKELESQIKEVESVKVENMILSAASGENFIDLSVVKVLVREELAGEDDIDSKAVEKAVKKIAKDKPYLVKSGDNTATPGAGNTAKKDLDGKTDEEKFAAWLKK